MIAVYCFLMFLALFMFGISLLGVNLFPEHATIWAMCIGVSLVLGLYASHQFELEEKKR